RTSAAVCAFAAVLASTVILLAPATAVAADEIWSRPSDGVIQISGHGWGHGRGMSQRGAINAATGTATVPPVTVVNKILDFYYPGTQPAQVADAPIRVLLSADEGIDVDVTTQEQLKVVNPASGG